MNRYRAEALEHWRTYLPGSYSGLEDPEEFFTELSEQADAEIEDRYLEYAGPDILGESAEDKQARLIQAMNRVLPSSLFSTSSGRIIWRRFGRASQASQGA